MASGCDDEHPGALDLNAEEEEHVMQGCPIDHNNWTAWIHPKLKGESIDPRNMMPVLSQEKDAEQTVDLSTNRKTSSIPKANANTSWMYPSAQQFYNAMKRKNKEPEADCMEATVFVHNIVNERTWKEILNWEQMHKNHCTEISLKRFVGKFSELSWGGQWHAAFSRLGRPFDRHDWYIDR
eukprot:Platyproteum_vivax@DN6054_c0_g1_i2.p1